MTFSFTRETETVVRSLVAVLSAPSVLAYPDWKAVYVGSRPFCLFVTRVLMDGFGAALEQEQPDGVLRPLVCISRATLDSERYWTPLLLY